jgi:hypothetical protein
MKEDWKNTRQGVRLVHALEYSPRAEEYPKGKIQQNEFAKAIGMKPSSVNQLISGLTKQFSSENTVKAAQWLKISVVWLGTGKGRMDMTDGQINKIFVVGSVGKAQSDNTVTITELGSNFIRFCSDDPDAKAFLSDDDSYRPMLKPGWLFVVEPNHPPTNGDPVLLQFTDGSFDLAEYLYDYRNSHRVYRSLQSGTIDDMRIAVEDIDQELYVGAFLPPSKLP